MTTIRNLEIGATGYNKQQQRQRKIFDTHDTHTHSSKYTIAFGNGGHGDSLLTMLISLFVSKPYIIYIGKRKN